MTTVARDETLQRTDQPPPVDDAGVPVPTGRVRRFVRGRRDDPRWVRPCLFLLLGGTALAYLWALGDSGWANSFYSAAVQAGTKSWKAFFFGSSDASNFITVDKPPAALWVMEISARVFGLSSWSILVPQALEGVATVGLLYATVRRWFTPAAALIAGTVLAVTPVASLMFRYNNPDALLVLLLTGAVYATVRALEGGSTRWLVLAGALVGTGFVTKMMQALVVVPALGIVYLLAGPPALGRRLGQLAWAAVALVVSSGWWVAAVELTPAVDRPYIGGSQDNSLLNLIFGYNGFGRLTGNEAGSVVAGGARGVLGGAGGGGSMWGPTGWDRLFLTDFGGQISWLLPTALILLAACLWLTRRSPRTDRTRAAFVLWGLVLVVTGATFSFAQGIIHPYYTVALAPAIGALVGMGVSTLCPRRRALEVRLVLGAAVAAGAVWSFVLLDRTPQWLPPLRFGVLVAGVATALLIAAKPRLRGHLAAAIAIVGGAAVLGGPAAYTLETVATPHSGAIPSAGPGGAGASAGPGGVAVGGPGPSAGAPGGSSTAGPAIRSAAPGGGTIGGAGAPGVAGGPGGAGGALAGPGGAGGALAGPGGAGGALGSSGASVPGPFNGPGAGSRGGGGSFLDGTRPGKAIVALLEQHAGRYRWVAATVNSNSAAGYQLATRDPVMAIGGFNGTDPAPTLAQFERYVHDGDVHYFIAGGSGPGQGGSGTTAAQITSWVESHFSSSTVDSVTVYDLTATPAARS